MRASVSRTDAAAISEYGPPSWKAASVSVKLTQLNTGLGQDRSAVLAAPDATELVDGGVVDERRPPVVLARSHESRRGVGELLGPRAVGRWARPVRISSKIE